MRGWEFLSAGSKCENGGENFQKPIDLVGIKSYNCAIEKALEGKGDGNDKAPSLQKLQHVLLSDTKLPDVMSRRDLVLR